MEKLKDYLNKGWQESFETRFCNDEAHVFCENCCFYEPDWNKVEDFITAHTNKVLEMVAEEIKKQEEWARSEEERGVLLGLQVARQLITNLIKHD